MNYYTYQEPLPNSNEPVTITVNETYIRLAYWPHWCKQMQKAGYTIDPDDQCDRNVDCCILDFRTVHWAVWLERQTLKEYRAK